jgi:hypothetical protein
MNSISLDNNLNGQQSLWTTIFMDIISIDINLFGIHGGIHKTFYNILTTILQGWGILTTKNLN